MANEWNDIIAVSAATDVDYVMLNKFGTCIRTWGDGLTPGTTYVDANQNALNNLGPLRFHATGGIEDGTLSLPGLKFKDEVNSGLRRAAAGTVQIVVGGVAALTVTSAGITQSAFIGATLQNSWVNFGSSFEVAAYMKDKQGFVHVVGCVKSGTMTNGTTLLTLPSGFRPTQIILRPLFNAGAGAILQIDPTLGTVDLYGVTTNAQVTFDFSFPTF